jgi:hypothetical protein
LAHDVFISHSSKDKPIADAVCARIESRGIRCWIAPRDVEPGRPYGEAIIDAIHTCRIMVLLLSSSANSSIHIAKEVERAVSHGATVIPLRIEAVVPAKSLDYFIGSVHWLDALTPPLEQHLDNLAEAILRILQVPRPPDVVVGGKISSTEQATIAPPPPIKPAASFPSPAAGHPKKRWLIPAIVGGGLLLVAAVVVVAVLLSNRTTDSARTSPVDVGPSSNPGGYVAPRNPGSAPSSDPLVGCWQWFNNSAVIVHSDGLLTAGPFTAHWRRVDSSRHIYTITWPEAVDATALSPDGRTLTGGNQYGFQMSATRLTGGAGLAGTWQWYNGAVVTIQPDGSFFVGNLRGRWRGSGLSYSLTWPKPVDTLTMSADRTRVDGGNQFGVHTSGTKSGSCGS